jgi:hypothetical protein
VVRPTNEERLLLALDQLGGVATPETLAEKLGWDAKDPGVLKRIGLIASHLIQSGRLKKRRAGVLYEFSGSSHR